MSVTTVMTQREEPGPSTDVLAHTKQSEPNVKIVVRPWWQMVLIRVIRVYLQTFSGLVAADATGLIDIDGIFRFMIAASFPALISLIQNSIEILTKLDTDEVYSTLRA